LSVIEHLSGRVDLAPAPRGSGLRDRWLGFRDRLLRSAWFQWWAARFPLTRPVANRRALQLFDISAGFVYSQVLKACLELDLFERVASEPLPIARLAELSGLAEEPLARLLLAAQSLELLEQRSNRCWGLGAHGAALLGNPGIAAMVRHHALLYADLADPVALLRQRAGSQLSTYWPYAVSDSPQSLHDGQVGAYSELMADSQALVADDILDHYSLRRHRSLLDVAGGEGVFASLAAERWPHLRVALLDLPAVADRARQRFNRLGLGRRVNAHGGDFLQLQGFEGADLISLVRVLHDHDDALVLQLLRATRRALRPGGRLLIAEPMAGTAGAERVGDAYFGLYLWAMGSGRARRSEELRALLQQAGYHGCQEIKTSRPLLVRLLVAQA
jgi:demethylspheroidene O-methyltransferase